MQHTHAHSVRELEHSAVEVTFTIPSPTVQKEYQVVCGKLQKEAQIKGFRKGRVPLPVLVKKFDTLLKEQTIESLISQPLSEALQDGNTLPQPISQPQLKDAPELLIDKDFIFTVFYDVFPSFSIPSVTDIVLKEYRVEISDEDIAHELEKYREQNAIIEESQDDTVSAGDLVTLDFAVQKEDGSIVEGSARQDFVLRAGSDDAPLSLGTHIIGLKKGISELYADPDNKETQISVKVTRIRSYQLPELDDELAQDIDEKYRSLEDLKTDIKTRMSESAETLLREQKVRALLASLREAQDFPIPHIMIEESFQLQLRKFLSQFPEPEKINLQQLESAGMGPAQLKAQWLPDIERSVREQVIVKTLIDERSIVISEEDAINYVKMHSGTEDPEALIEESKKSDLLQRVKQELAEKALFDGLFSEVNTEKADTFSYTKFVEFLRSAEGTTQKRTDTSEK